MTTVEETVLKSPPVGREAFDPRVAVVCAVAFAGVMAGLHPNDLDRDSRQRLIERLLSLMQAMVIVSHDRDFLEQVAPRSCRLENAVLRPCDDLSFYTRGPNV